MISLTCTSCKKVLQIDDAFAGGVCRCQYCGTIQTVPAALKQQSRAGAPAQGTGARTLYQRMPHGRRAAAAAAAAAQGGSAGGDEDAEAPRNRAAVPGQPGRPTAFSPKILGLIGGGIVVLALLGWLLFR
jgi:hypothetical protein